MKHKPKYDYNLIAIFVGFVSMIVLLASMIIINGLNIN